MRLITRHLALTDTRIGLLHFDQLDDEYGQLRFYRLELLFVRWRGWPCVGVTLRGRHRADFLELGYGLFDHTHYTY